MKGNNMAILKLDFKQNEEAQDMLVLLEKETSLSAIEAIKFSINKQIAERIIIEGWASIALSLWGHDDYEREWLTHDNPIFEIEISEEQEKIFNIVKNSQKVNEEIAMTYFLMFALETFGYHL